MSMRTGQASKHAPHNDDAYGRLAFGSSWPVVPVSRGLRIAPMGPGYTEP